MSANLDNGVMLGALGSSARISGGTLAPPKGMVIAAIQFCGKATIESLVSENNNKFINSNIAANNLSAGDETGAGDPTETEGSGGEALGSSQVFAMGSTIYGRWTSVEVSDPQDGPVIAYFGY